MISVDQIIDEIIEREGGAKYTNDPNDAGGPTKFGITQRTLSAYVGHPVTPQDVQNLTLELAQEIYRDNFYRNPKIDQLPEGLQACVMDMGVNAGPRKAIQLLQQVVTMAGFPCHDDGVIGPGTRKTVETAFEKMQGYLINAYAEMRVHYYQHLVEVKPTNAKFLRGWTNRANSFRVEV